MPTPDDDTPSPLPAFITRVRHPEDYPCEERHPILGLLRLLLRLPLALLVILLWLSLLCLIRPLEWLYTRIKRRPHTPAPLTETLRPKFSAWVLRLL